MIHDFAKSPRTYRFESGFERKPTAQPRKLPKIRWLLLLCVLAVIAYWRTHAQAPDAESEFVPGKTESKEYQEAVAQEEQEAATQAAQVQAQQKLAESFKEKLKNLEPAESEFGFYDSLSKSSWKVPVQRGVYVTEADRQKANQRYMLQAASVREAGEAQRIVQRLRQLGMQAFYSHEETNGWYRVNVGPFDNVSKMNKAEDILVSLRMMPLKRKI